MLESPLRARFVWVALISYSLLPYFPPSSMKLDIPFTAGWVGESALHHLVIELANMLSHGFGTHWSNH